MEIHYLEEFIVLAESLNFGEAALRLNMAQSTLSKHIKALETELGGELFHRSTRRMALSPFGEFYLPYAREISSLNQEAGQKLRAYMNENGTSFTLAAIHNIQYFNIDRLIIGFRTACPECRLNVVEGEENELLSMFRRRQTNLFTAYVFDGETPEYDFLPLGESRVVALLPEEHRLADSYALSLGQLRNENILLPDRNTKLCRRLLAAFAEAGVTPRVVYEGGSSACVDLVRAGMGISLQPREFALWRPETSVSCVDIKPFVTFRYGLGYRNDRSLSASEKKLLAYLRQSAPAGHPPKRG